MDSWADILYKDFIGISQSPDAGKPVQQAAARCRHRTHNGNVEASAQGLCRLTQRSAAYHHSLRVVDLYAGRHRIRQRRLQRRRLLAERLRVATRETHAAKSSR